MVENEAPGEREGEEGEEHSMAEKEMKKRQGGGKEEETKQLTGQKGDSGSPPLRYCHGDELQEGKVKEAETEVSK